MPGWRVASGQMLARIAANLIIVHSAVPEGASILELGCGTGRILRPLAGLGHPVLGVDESEAMLARIPDLPTACSPVQTLRLDRTFGAVLLASTMINVDPALRRAFLATCRTHLSGGGVAVFQQNPPSWFDTIEQAPRVRDDPGGIRRVIRSARRDGPRMRIEVEYHVGDRVWTHAWGSHEIREDELVAELSSAGRRQGTPPGVVPRRGHHVRLPRHPCQVCQRQVGIATAASASATSAPAPSGSSARSPASNRCACPGSADPSRASRPAAVVLPGTLTPAR